MSYWGLTEQLPHVVFIATTKRRRHLEFQGSRFQFVTLKPPKFFGFTGIPIDGLEVKIADPEKTIVDCLDQEAYGGGMIEIDPFPLIAMRLEEILAEKLRATLMRSAPRDVLDLWAVLTQREVDTSVVFELLPRKLATVGMVFDEAVLWSNLSAAGGTREQELRPLVYATPGFQRVAVELRECLAGRSRT